MALIHKLYVSKVLEIIVPIQLDSRRNIQWWILIMLQGLEVRSNTSLGGVTRRCLSSSTFLKLRASSAALRQPPQAQNHLPQLRLCSPSAHKTQPMPGGLRRPLPWPLFCLSCWLIGSVWAVCCVSMSPSRTKVAVPRRGTSAVTGARHAHCW